MDNKVFKVIIAGSRDFNDYELLKNNCDKILSNKLKDGYEIQIISGTAIGADVLGEVYASKNNYKIIRMPANWEEYGKRAGYIRNEEMAKIANACICFWDEESKGTKHMIDLAIKYNLLYRVILYKKFSYLKI